MNPMGPIKRLFRMIFKPDYARFFKLGRESFDFDREVGEPLRSSTVAAPVLWFARNFPEAPPALWKHLDAGKEEQDRQHPMLQLLQRPNEFYTGPMLWMATMTDWNVNGNGYWIVIPSRSGRPLELWWTPSWMIQPRGKPDASSSYVSHYEYVVDGEPYNIDPKYVVHFRYGLDPDNPRKGSSPLQSVLREVFTDNEAVIFTASLLRNMGVPGLMVSPEKGASLTEDQAREAKEDLLAQFKGDKRGEPIVGTGPTKIEQFGFSPDQLLLKELRRIPEERVTAVLGVPAVVAGLGAGLDRSTFTNMAEAREAAYESGLIPAQKIVGEDVRFQLLPLFGEDPFAFRFGFDLSKVRVLQEDLYRQAQRHATLVREGIEMVSEARYGMGLEVDENRDDVFLRPTNISTVPAGDAGQPDTPAVVDPGLSGARANGHASASEIADELERRLDRRELTTS